MLSDKSRFEMFARTVPPDTFQVTSKSFIVLQLLNLLISCRAFELDFTTCHILISRQLHWWTLSRALIGHTYQQYTVKDHMVSLFYVIHTY